ncbi:hypothetical protein Hanom_Chr00s172118g01829211 [Helianthus anomalus]
MGLILFPFDCRSAPPFEETPKVPLPCRYPSFFFPLQSLNYSDSPSLRYAS